MADGEHAGLRRLPIYLVLDTSSSMAGEPIETVRENVRVLLSDLQTDPQALETVWLSAITFDSEARQVVPLTPLVDFEAPALEAGSGGCALGAALRLLMAAAERDVRPAGPGGEKGDWKPLICIMTGAHPTDEWEPVADELRRSSAITVVGCAAGPEASDQVLKRITGTIVRLQPPSPPSSPSLRDYWSGPRRQAVTDPNGGDEGAAPSVPLPDLPQDLDLGTHIVP